MIRSKKITDFFEAKLSDLRPLVTLEFDVHLYFSQNEHRMILCREGEAPSEEFINKYKARGLERIWIHKEDQAAYTRYIHEKTLEGAMLTALMTSSGNEEEETQKKIIAAAAAQELVNKLGSSSSPEEQKKANERIRIVIRDVLDKTAIRSETAIADLLNLCEVDPELTHAVNVATYATTFAMAFGKIEPDLVSDIALAGLLHDVGLSQVPLKTLATPRRSMDPETREEYASHVRVSLDLLENYAQKIPERVKTLIEQHHEKFDGSGYPQKLSGQKVNDLAQILALANQIETVSSGRWDGTKRTLKEALELIKVSEIAKTSPEFFHPALLKAVLTWVYGKEVKDEELSQVVETVGNQARAVSRML